MRQYVRIDDFIEMHRHPETGKRMIGRDGLYAAIRSGHCPHVRVGRRILVPTDALDIMSQRSGAGAASGPLTSDAA